MILGVPVVNGKELTKEFVKWLQPVVKGAFRLVIIDNASDDKYCPCDFKNSNFPIDIIRNEKNTGYYAPLKQLYDKYPDEELIGLTHNDMIFYEDGWDLRMHQVFANDPQLGLVGLCGSTEIDALGGRGSGTMVNFMEREIIVGDKHYKGQSRATGRNIDNALIASVTFDSLFMMFRRDVIPHLCNERDSWEHLTLAHFYDRIWPIRVIEAGYRCATLGVNCDHLGGMTCTANMRYYNDCIKWLNERNIPYENPETEMYLVAERRYLSEYKTEKRFLPCIIGENYAINHLAR